MSEVGSRKLGVVAIVMLVGSLLVYRPEHAGIWWQYLFDWMHVPVFGALAFATLAALPPGWKSQTQAMVAFMVCALLAVSTEAVQAFLGRDASLSDLAADLAGATVALLAFLAVRLKGTQRVAVALSSLLLFSWTLSPMLLVSRAILDRNARFPVIFSGDAIREEMFLSGEKMLIGVDWDAERGRIFTRLSFLADSSSKLEFRDLSSDWLGRSSLIIEAYVDGADPVELSIRVNDSLHRIGAQHYDDRFNAELRFSAGWNEIEIPLRSIASAPSNRRMDLSKVDAIVLFTGPNATVRTIDLYGIRLR